MRKDDKLSTSNGPGNVIRREDCRKFKPVLKAESLGTEPCHELW